MSSSPPSESNSASVTAEADRTTGARVWALSRYVFAATLVRSADGGAVVAIVLLARDTGLAPWVSGLLGAAITAPHLLGPFIARRLDTARDGRRVIAVSALIHGALLAVAALLMPLTWPLWPAILLFVSGLFGPMLTGGVSSRLPSIAGPTQRNQRRAQSWDVASYGISGTLGPAAVAWIAAANSPLLATLVLAAAAIIGAGAVLALPKQAPSVNSGTVPSPARTLRTIWVTTPLRHTLGLTILVAFSVAVLPIYAVAVAPGFGSAALAGTLVAGYGVGSLLGSALLMIWPLRGDAGRLIIILAIIVGVALAVVIVMPSFIPALIAFTLAGVANSLFFAATLAARSEYSPPQARGQVFIWVGALKIAAGSAGTAVAGALIVGIPWLPVAGVAAACIVIALLTALNRTRNLSRKVA